MQYQLTLQFPGDSLAGYDAMVALEEQFVEELGNSARVGDHEIGSGETKIFIFTSDPATTFQRLKSVLERAGHLQEVTAAYREIHGERETVIWARGRRWTKLLERFATVSTGFEYFLYFVAGCAGAWFLGAYAGWGFFGYIAGFVLGFLLFIAAMST